MHVFFFQNQQHAMPKMLLDRALPLFLAQADAAPAAQQPPSAWNSLIFMVLIFGAMYFLMIAPQRKKQKEHEKMLSSLGTGDEILTTGGIFGVITSVKDDRFIVRIAEGTKIELGKGFIQTVVKKTPAA
jgi:preprotein translocase subunit YajC